MELYKEILAKVIEQQKIEVTFPNLQISANEIVALECYQTLQKIQAIIQDDDLSDFACVEEIVRLFETLGSDGGNRHDF